MLDKIIFRKNAGGRNIESPGTPSQSLAPFGTLMENPVSRALTPCFAPHRLLKAVFPLLGWLVLASGLSAQTGPAIHPPCGSLQIEIVPSPYDGSADDQPLCFPCCGPTNCQRMRYDVFLRAVPPAPGAWSNGNFNMGYAHLVVKVRLNLVKGAVTSINEPLTEAATCLAAFLGNGNPAVTFDAKEGEATLLVTNMTGEVTPLVPFQQYRTTQPLFQVFVDGFPGEEFGLECAELSYVNDFHVCTSQPGCIGNTVSTFPPPSVASAATLSLEANCVSPLFMLVPVTVSMLPPNVNFMDFAVEIACAGPNAPRMNAPPQATGFNGGIPLPTVRVLEMEDKVRYLLHARYPSFSASGLPGGTVLFTIRVPRPEDAGETHTLTATLRPGRVRSGQSIGTGPSFQCHAFSPDSEGSVECAHVGEPPCPDMWLTVEPSSVPPSECGNLTAYARLNWNFGNEPTRAFKIFKALLEFDLQPGVTISGAYLENITCPTSAPYDCPGGCFYVSGNTVNLCINDADGITLDANTRIRIEFNGNGGCVMSGKARRVTVKRIIQNVSTDECRPAIHNMGLLCPKKIEGDIAMENGCFVDAVSVHVAPVGGGCAPINFVANLPSASSSCAVPYSKCVCEGVSQYQVTPAKNDNPLNGVTTFDLALIQKHILGLEVLDSPYKMIAADANKSNSVTTVDMSLLRSLILGLVSELPNNTSWRFVPKSYVFPNPSNPFQTTFPENGIYILPTTEADFVAIKVGDVNLSALTGCSNDCDAFQKPVGEAALEIPASGLRAGEHRAFPVVAATGTPLVAWQMALRFDPDALELVGPAQGDLGSLNEGNFGLTRAGQGLVRALWFAQPGEEAPLQAGQTLFRLAFRAKRDIPDPGGLLRLDDEALAGLGWGEAGDAYALRLRAAPETESREQAGDTPLSATCRPNPAAAEVGFDLTMPQAGKARLSIYGAFGTRVFFREYALEQGPHALTVPQAAEWPAGVYHWELRHGKQRAKGTFIRQ
ncbi:MAG: hypothetical protein KF734_06495 [Saprospiraceae bacterium]|nr:hypothetical protein [Saprospiraceae bacterium]